MSTSLTTKKIDSARRKARQATKEVWVTDGGGARNTGRLALRCLPSGVVRCYAIFYRAGRKESLSLGHYDEQGAPGLTLAGARRALAEHSAIYASGVASVRDHLSDERQRMEREAQARREHALRARSQSLRHLLDAYSASLRSAGKGSAAEVECLFRLHVYRSDETLATKRAADVTARDLAALIKLVVEKGKRRTAGKLRSYLRAAFQWGINAQTDPNAPANVEDFALTHNPVTAVGTVRGAIVARQRALSESELRGILNVLSAASPSRIRDAILVGILLGGQRPTQLLRVRGRDCDADAGTVTLYDAKGRRDQPRRHVLPLTPRVAALLNAQGDGAAFLFSSNGRNSTRVETLSKYVSSLSGRLVADGVIGQPFRLGDLRRTCETHLAKIGVSKDLRAQLLSHGLSGVQARHYDRHDYLPELTGALLRWTSYLDGVASVQSNVAQFSPKRAA